MLKKILIISFVVFAAGSAYVFAISEPNKQNNSLKVETETVTFDKSLLKNKLQQTLGMPINDIVETPFTGVVVILTDQGSFYASSDGNYFISGKIYDLNAERPTELAEASLATIRVEGMKKFSDDMIVYPAENEKYVVTVFTDITCGYCRKMHKQMPEYNALGITVRYLPYPRSGVVDRTGNLSDGFKNLRSIWCHENPAEALTKAKLGSSVAQRICDKPIEEEFSFGRQVGVNGTPAIMLANGEMLSGYRPPNDLAEYLAAL